MFDALRRGWPRRIVGLAWFGVELAVADFLAMWLTVLISTIPFYFGPWADPPGMNYIHAVLLAAGSALAIWRAARRWCRTPVGAAAVEHPARDAHDQPGLSG